MIRRLVLFLLFVWLGGFAWFAVMLPQPRDGGRTDGAVVLTGGRGRIDRGLLTLRKQWAPRLLVSGVDRDVKPAEFEKSYSVSSATMKCCITLGFEAYDTQSNARETARWIAREKLKSIRLITTDWHMRRAAYELDRMITPGVKVVIDAVPSDPSLKVLFTEYNKLLARRASWLWDG